MSIIVEALKKAQGSLKTTFPSRREDTSPPPGLEVRKSKIKKHITVWVVTSFLLLAVLSFYFLSHNLIKETLPTSLPTDDSVALKEEVEKPSYALGPIEKETPPIISSLPIISSPSPVTPSPSLTFSEVKELIDLKGIMYTPEKPRALINGSVLDEGDYMGKFKISKIEKDSIKVISEGQEFIIKLKR